MGKLRIIKTLSYSPHLHSQDAFGDGVVSVIFDAIAVWNDSILYGPVSDELMWGV